MSDNGFITHNLKNNVAHFLISGTTRYGKSNLLRMIVKKVYGAKINIIDFKGADYAEFKDKATIITDNEEANMLLESLWIEKNKRMEILSKNSQKQYKKDFIITIIDEFAILEDKEIITKLLQQGAAAGIIFMIATQYPRNDIVDKLITINCDVRIALHMKDTTASRVVLENDLAKTMPAIKGRAIYQYGDDKEVQIPFAD